MSDQAYWEGVYSRNAETSLSWFQNSPDNSLALITKHSALVNKHVLDVGAGTSRLIDKLLHAGVSSVSILDLSEVALKTAYSRIPPDNVDKVSLLHGNVLNYDLQPASIDIWHDRAVFHFLTEHQQRQSYLELLARVLAPNGLFVISTFAHDGPERCSGLPVCRYSIEELKTIFGEEFSLLESIEERHLTPTGRAQSFIYGCFKYTPAVINK